MPHQLALRFDEVPITCPTQERYHSIAPILAGKSSPAEQAEILNLGYSTVTRWLRQFREKGIPGLFPADQYPREPYTPDRVIVALLYLKCCAPKASYFELSRVISHPHYHAHPFQSKQMTLFDPPWVRDPVEPSSLNFQRPPKTARRAEQLRLYLGPELVKSA
jgi:hypothetical protein